jgi:hypothetical protein
VRFLGILRLRRVGTRHVGHVVLAEALADDAARFRDGFSGHGHAIGAHIGNEAGSFSADRHALIKTFHGARRGKAELA